jgi:hypothetical protein
MKLAIICPSYIQSYKRLNFAKTSFSSLIRNTGASFQTFVIDDVPSFHGLFGGIKSLLFKNSAVNVYNGYKNVTLTRRSGHGSLSALIHACKIAKSSGFKYVFIHLDDNIYIPKLKNLLIYSNFAMDNNKNLKIIRLTGRPILSADCDFRRGNETFINKGDNKITFSMVKLKPVRFEEFTLWKSTFTSHMTEKYWPIALWSSVYEIDFLMNVLHSPNKIKFNSLAQVELYYQDRKNWTKLIKAYPGELGYINMQFCGLEMQRNRNWKKLINYPNFEIL